MARVRSPNYPAVGLPDAIERIKKVYEREQQLPADREVIAQHLGYGGLNGASLKVISALIKYGLLEEAKDGELRVSERSIRILYPESPEDKASAIREAAIAPALFAEFESRWEGQQPSDESLRAYLIRRHFSQSAIDGVIGSYRDTRELVAHESDGYDDVSNSPQNNGEKEQPMQPVTSTSREQARPAPPPSSGMRVSITDAGLEVSANLKDAREVEKLIRVLKANKLLLLPDAAEFDDLEVDDER